jgi:hypothetical protein
MFAPPLQLTQPGGRFEVLEERKSHVEAAVFVVLCRVEYPGKFSDAGIGQPVSLASSRLAERFDKAALFEPPQRRVQRAKRDTGKPSSSRRAFNSYPWRGRLRSKPRIARSNITVTQSIRYRYIESI